ncbi:MAG: DUF4157 domain-containing protein [Leptolyngbyaceae cyanobacterium]
MSEFSNDLTQVLVPTSDFSPGHQLPGQPFMMQPKEQRANPTSAVQDVARMQQLDAGVAQTLGIQAKLAIGAPGDKYEQEADSVAAQVVDRIHSPQVQQQTVQRQELEEDDELQMKSLGQTIQREAMPEEEEDLQMKPLAQTIQREAMPEEEEDLQMKPLAQAIQRQEVPEEEEDLQMKPVQRKGAAGGVASADLESSITAARGQGQPLGDDVRGSMEQAFGADFSGVRIHTNSQSDQLNQSIQARAFTTGQDVFFRQGEYQPGNRGGQELLAHELTHVVQQNGSTVQPKTLM